MRHYECVSYNNILIIEKLIAGNDVTDQHRAAARESTIEYVNDVEKCDIK